MKKKPLDLSALFLQPAWAKPSRVLRRTVINAGAKQSSPMPAKSHDVGLQRIIERKQRGNNG